MERKTNVCKILATLKFTYLLATLQCAPNANIDSFKEKQNKMREYISNFHSICNKTVCFDYLYINGYYLKKIYHQLEIFKYDKLY